MDLELVIREGLHPGRTFRVRAGEKKTIGRAPECDIRLADVGVSRRHCTVENKGDTLELVDLQSANGSYVNGEPVQTGALGPGDELAVGPTVLACRVMMPERPVIAGASTTLAFREEGTTTLVRKVVDTHYPGLEALSGVQAGDVEVLRHAQRNLATAYQVSKLLSRARAQEELFLGVIDSILRAINADRAAILLKDKTDGSGSLQVMTARSRKPGQDADEITVSRTVVQDVLENGVSTLSHDATADARYKEGQSIIQQKIRSVMCAPVATDETIIGVLYADSRSLTGAFTEGDLELLALIGNLAGVALHRVQLIAEQVRWTARMKDLSVHAIEALADAVDKKDGYTHGHSKRVAQFAKRMAKELGKSEEEIEIVVLSGLLHDVGKIGVRESILNKPGKLTPEEFEEIKKHPTYGWEILSKIPHPLIDAILPGVRNHHEKWNGKGYPDGLAGEEIPFLGRLLAVADVLDALSSDRSYRPSLGFNRAVEMIVEEAGTHFDPEIAEAAAILHARGDLEVPPEPLALSLDPTPTANLRLLETSEP